jgi:hypothetical protein
MVSKSKMPLLSAEMPVKIAAPSALLYDGICRNFDCKEKANKPRIQQWSKSCCTYELQNSRSAPSGDLKTLRSGPSKT